jgi:hypothetical protein
MELAGELREDTVHYPNLKTILFHALDVTVAG